MNKYQNINSKTNKTIKRQIVDFLLKDELENYGYDLTDWQRIQRQRNKAKSILKIADINKLKWEELGCRFQIKKASKGNEADVENSKAEIQYIVCQSKNEEITNAIRRLVGLKGWAS